MSRTDTVAVNPNAIAAEIVGNCDAYNAGLINRARWDAEQKRLWKMAADAGLAAVVMRLTCPSSLAQLAQHRTTVKTMTEQWAEEAELERE